MRSNVFIDIGYYFLLAIPLLIPQTAHGAELDLFSEKDRHGKGVNDIQKIPSTFKVRER
jgi:hypothetical protein